MNQKNQKEFTIGTKDKNLKYEYEFEYKKKRKQKVFALREQNNRFNLVEWYVYFILH